MIRFRNLLQVGILFLVLTTITYYLTRPSDDKAIYSGEMRFLDATFPYNLYLPMVKNPNKICDNKRILVAIKSAPKNIEKRSAIRESWGDKQNAPNDYLIVFFIGAQNNSNVELELTMENEDFGDLVRYDLVDSYRNLTTKIYAMYDWFQVVCPEAKYLLQLDDDVAIDLKRFDYFVQKEFDQIVEKQDGVGLFCTMTTGNPVLRNPDNKQYVPEKAYAPSTYPDYCLGPTMVLTHKAVSKLLAAVPKKYFISVDDVFYSGLVRMETDVPLHDPGIFCLYKKQNQEKCKDGPKSTIRIAADCRLEPNGIAPTYRNISQMTCP